MSGFIKTDLDLLAVPGISPRLRELYGRLALHAGKDGRCHPRWATLAREIGVKDRTTVYRLLRELKSLRLVDWKRYGRYANEYEVLVPDVAFLQRQTLHGRNLSDVAGTQPIIDKRRSKEIFKRGPQPPTPSPGGKGSRPPATVPECSGPIRERPAGKKTAKAKAVDDDEAPPPEQEFRRRLERHGAGFDADACVANVNRQLVKCGGLSFAEFVAYDQQHSTGTAFRNPNGYYTHLVRQFRQHTVQAAADAVTEPLRQAAANAPPETERDSRGLCARCGGPGTIAGGSFCSCPIGRDLEKAARRKPKSETNPPLAGKGQH